VHQPTAPFELVINKKAWGKLSDADKQLIKDAAFLTTMDSWLTIGDEDAKALEYFKSKGNEIIELDAEVQYAGREAGLKWAEGVAKENAYFKKVLDQQNEYFSRWKDSGKYRNVKVR
jgi:TRAP-type mannitol/chloroaromatic compound transport system substrate-binding protein